MKAWAIRNKNSGRFLPLRTAGRGFTFDEPIDGCLPRLFRNRHAAHLALRAWLKGHWVCIRTRCYDGESDEEIRIKPVADRKAEDMEIVELSITERKAA